MDILVIVLTALLAVGLGGVTGFFGKSIVSGRNTGRARDEATRILDEAEEQKKQILVNAKEEALANRNAIESDLRERRSDLQRMERRVANREENAERRLEDIDKTEKDLQIKEEELEGKLSEVKEIKEKEETVLEQISGLSANDARGVVLDAAEKEMEYEIARRYRDRDQQAKEDADHKARKILTLSINRLASEVVSENTVKFIPLPNDDMKGRLIGREGRNIRAIEAATGVDLIIDDTPEAVSVSCFDPIRREVARRAISKLVTDGRIHPARIEDVVEKAKEELDEEIRSDGEQAVLDAGVMGLNPELIKLLGRLKYRYSYGENILTHSVEVAHLSGMIAAEVGGVSIPVAKAGG